MNSEDLSSIKNYYALYKINQRTKKHRFRFSEQATHLISSNNRIEIWYICDGIYKVYIFEESGGCFPQYGEYQELLSFLESI